MKSKYLFFAGLAITVMGFTIAVAVSEEAGTNCAVFGLVVMLLIFPIFVILETLIRYRELEEKRREKQQMIRAARAAAKEKLRKQEEERQKQFQIVEVKYLGPGATSQKRGGLGGAVMGGMIGGTMGAVVGASLPKNGKSLHCFAVKYGDGSVKIREVHPNSLEFNELMSYVKWEDLP